MQKGRGLRTEPRETLTLRGWVEKELLQRGTEGTPRRKARRETRSAVACGSPGDMVLPGVCQI